MTRKKTLILLGIAGLLIAVTVIVIIQFTSPQKEYVSWYETYRPDDKQPYGAYLLTELLEEQFDVQMVEDDPRSNLNEYRYEGATYLFLGRNYYMSDSFSKSLANFVARGNDALIISSYIPEMLAHDVNLIGDCRYWLELITYRNRELYMNFKHPRLARPDGYTLEYYFQDSVKFRSYQLIDSSYQYCGDIQKLVPLGYTDEAGFNFFVVPHGDGRIYFHTLPLAFTNIELKREEMLEYAEKVFAHLPDQKIFFDQYSRLPSFDFRPELGQSQSPLVFIFHQDSLRWAWYLLLATALLYIFFTAKRKQRIIPVIPPKANTSLQYTETLGRLYHQQRDHRKLALLEMKHLLTYLHRHLNINPKMEEAKLIGEISTKTKQPVGRVEELFHQYHRIEKRSRISEATLIDFYEKMQILYEHGRKS